MIARSLRSALLGAVATLALPAAAEAQLSGSGCGGNAFLFCATWQLEWLNANSLRLTVTNTSANANSAFTQVGIGNIGVATDPTGVGDFLVTTAPPAYSALSGWELESPVNGFNGANEVPTNNYGVRTTNGVNNALLAGQTLRATFSFTGNPFATDAIFSDAFFEAKFYVHDQGTPTNLLDQKTTCGSSKGVLNFDGSSTTPTSFTCTPNQVPEPSTFGLVFAGLAGLVGMRVLRRRNA